MKLALFDCSESSEFQETFSTEVRPSNKGYGATEIALIAPNAICLRYSLKRWFTNEVQEKGM